MTIDNVWPSNFNINNTITPPKNILNKQVEYFNESHQGLLTAQLGLKQDISAAGTAYFVISLSIKAPTLGNYSFLLLNLEHNINLYPCSISDTLNGKPYTNLQNEEDVLNALREIFNSASTIKAIGTLKAQL